MEKFFRLSKERKDPYSYWRSVEIVPRTPGFIKSMPLQPGHRSIQAQLVDQHFGARAHHVAITEPTGSFFLGRFEGRAMPNGKLISLAHNRTLGTVEAELTFQNGKLFLRALSESKVWVRDKVESKKIDFPSPSEIGAGHRIGVHIDTDSVYHIESWRALGKAEMVELKDNSWLILGEMPNGGENRPIDPETQSVLRVESASDGKKWNLVEFQPLDLRRIEKMPGLESYLATLLGHSGEWTKEQFGGLFQTMDALGWSLPRKKAFLRAVVEIDPDSAAFNLKSFSKILDILREHGYSAELNDGHNTFDPLLEILTLVRDSKDPAAVEKLQDIFQIVKSWAKDPEYALSNIRYILNEARLLSQQDNVFLVTGILKKGSLPLTLDTAWKALETMSRLQFRLEEQMRIFDQTVRNGREEFVNFWTRCFETLQNGAAREAKEILDNYLG
ncbi:hypothetical protein F9K50_09050 [bacterium]|nr:MAG: hypothetical protein F9K50_09050 [bacterium]